MDADQLVKKIFAESARKNFVGQLLLNTAAGGAAGYLGGQGDPRSALTGAAIGGLGTPAVEWLKYFRRVKAATNLAKGRNYFDFALNPITNAPFNPAVRREFEAIRNKEHLMDIASITTAGLGGYAVSRNRSTAKKPNEKTAAMGAMEQPAMGTGRGLKKRRITKTAGPRWDAVKRFFASLGDLGNQAAIRAMHRDSMRVMTPEQLQALGPAPSADEMIRRIAAANNKITKTAQDDIQETLSEMLSQAQYHADNQQPFWADQGSTDQSNVSDTFYGHGRGLTRRQARAIKKTASLLLGRRY